MVRLFESVSLLVSGNGEQSLSARGSMTDRRTESVTKPSRRAERGAERAPDGAWGAYNVQTFFEVDVEGEVRQ